MEDYDVGFLLSLMLELLDIDYTIPFTLPVCPAMSDLLPGVKVEVHHLQTLSLLCVSAMLLAIGWKENPSDEGSPAVLQGGRIQAIASDNTAPSPENYRRSLLAVAGVDFALRAVLVFCFFQVERLPIIAKLQKRS